MNPPTAHHHGTSFYVQIKKGRRVVVHIPSLSVNASQRVTVDNLYKQQNRAITRLCEIKDPNVDVVYVAPFQMTDDLVLYYERLMEVGGVSNPKGGPGPKSLTFAPTRSPLILFTGKIILISTSIPTLYSPHSFSPHLNSILQLGCSSWFQRTCTGSLNTSLCHCCCSTRPERCGASATS